MCNMTVAESFATIIEKIGQSIAESKVNALSEEIGELNKKRHLEMARYLDEHPDDIEGAREKFGVIPYEERRTSWYQHEMM